MKHTHRVCQRCARYPCMSDKNGTAFITTPNKFALIEEFSEKESLDSGRKYVDQLLQALRAADKR